MFEFIISFALLAQVGSSSESAAASQPDRESLEVSELRKIYVRDSSEALRVDIVHPLQPICVRKPVLGSRVKVRTVCQDQAAWKAYQLAREADADEWGNAQRGLDIKD